MSTDVALPSPSNPAKQLTAEQLGALQRFAQAHGRSWKRKLSDAWFDGTDARGSDGPYLRQVRNEFGPSWLKAFRFPELRKSRYLVSESWEHIFTEAGREVARITRFAFDIEAMQFVVLDIRRNHKWHAATRVEKADLQESLVEANAGAFDDPADWDCELTDSLPTGWN